MRDCGLMNKAVMGGSDPPEKASDLIVLHAGWEKGRIPNVDLVFCFEKNTSDYHNDECCTLP